MFRGGTRDAECRSPPLAHGRVCRGLGRSYGDPANNQNEQVMNITRLYRYRVWDASIGVLSCEVGVTLDQIIQDFTPKGWFPTITPGTKFVTIGGCIANDIHGKAHHHKARSLRV